MFVMEKGRSGRKEQKVRRSEGEKVSVEEGKTVRPSDLLNFSPSACDLPFSVSREVL